MDPPGCLGDVYDVLLMEYVLMHPTVTMLISIGTICNTDSLGGFLMQLLKSLRPVHMSQSLISSTSSRNTYLQGWA